MIDNRTDTVLPIRDIKLCLWGGFEASPPSSDHQIYMIKDRRFLSALSEVLDRVAPRRMIELGVFDGGSTIYWMERYSLERLAAFDAAPGAPALTNYLDRHALADRVSTHFGVLQDDKVRLQDAVLSGFGNELVDVVIDDASHLYSPTRASLEILLPFVRPGGVYVIEDWAWAPLQPIMGELPLLLWEPAGAVERIEIDKNFVVLWRGNARLPTDGTFRLTDRPPLGGPI
jgi:cephalosporin hydroxylase